MTGTFLTTKKKVVFSFFLYNIWKIYYQLNDKNVLIENMNKCLQVSKVHL